jgi:hypothetical protein
MLPSSSMSMRPLPPERYAGDHAVTRVRRCAQCRGEMHCRSLVELRVNGGNAGRSYTFVCQGCRETVSELSPERVAYTTMVVVLSGGLGALLVGGGVNMLVDTIRHGSRGNDLSAVILVLVVFLGLGTPCLLIALWMGKQFLADAMKLRKTPVIR